jgi:hypothetical protein
MRTRAEPRAGSFRDAAVLGYDPGFELAGPSWGVTISLVPLVIQTHVFQLAARAGADLISSSSSGAATLMHYSLTTPSGAEAGENGWGYRFGAGLSIRIGQPQKGSGSINQFVTPGAFYGRMFLETVEISCWQFQVAFSGFMGL